jgi:hypothetical protein
MSGAAGWSKIWAMWSWAWGYDWLVRVGHRWASSSARGANRSVAVSPSGLRPSTRVST